MTLSLLAVYPIDLCFRSLFCLSQNPTPECCIIRCNRALLSPPLSPRAPLIDPPVSSATQAGNEKPLGKR